MLSLHLNFILVFKSGLLILSEEKLTLLTKNLYKSNAFEQRQTYFKLFYVNYLLTKCVSR